MRIFARSFAAAALAALTFATAPARADEAPAPPRTGAEPGEAAATATPAASPLPAWLTLGGFVDTSVVVPFESDPDVLFGLDEIELDVLARPTDGLTVRLDLNAFPAESVALDDRLVEQGFVEYFFQGGAEGFFLTAGKRNAPVGVESLDPVDKFTASHGLLFTFATPSNLTGFFGGWVGDGLTVMAWVTNDWDLPVTSDSAIAGGRVAYAFGDTGTLGLSGTWGPFVADDPRTMLDLDLALTNGSLTLFLEGNFGRQAEENSLGVLVAARYDFTEHLGASLRWDWLDRPFDGLDNVSSATAAFLFAFNDYVLGRLEVRADMVDFAPPDWTGTAQLMAKF